MRAIEKGGVSSAAFPVLELFAIDPSDGFLKDVFSATFEIFDADDVSTFGPTVVNTTADRIALGRYGAAWSVPTDEPSGTHTITWVYDFVSGGPTDSYTRTFEVLAAGSVGDPLARLYTSVREMREQGVTTKMSNARRVNELIVLASEYIEMFTGLVFEPVGKVADMDGRATRIMMLDEPIVAIADILIDTSPFSPSDLPIDPSLFRVYNRHLSQSLLHPDDRDNPKIEMFIANQDIEGFANFVVDRPFFPRGKQNIHIAGVFGYTHPNGRDLIGITPNLIQHAAALFVIRNLPKLIKHDERDELKRTHLVTEHRTRDQQIKYDMPQGRGSVVGAFTGDPEIDTILARFQKPLQMASA